MTEYGTPLLGERRLPRKSLLISLSGAAGAIAITAYGARYGMDALPPPWLIFGILLFLMMLGQWPTLFAYVSGPRRLLFSEDALLCDAVSYPYTQMTGIIRDVGADATRIELVNGHALLLRWDIWINHADWNALLQQRTFAHLHALAEAMLERGEKVAFGKRVALDRHALHLPEGSLPLGSIVEIRFSDERDNGARTRTLHVASIDRQLSVDTRRLRNQHVLFALLRELLP